MSILVNDQAHQLPIKTKEPNTVLRRNNGFRLDFHCEVSPPSVVLSTVKFLVASSYLAGLLWTSDVLGGLLGSASEQLVLITGLCSEKGCTHI
jgi:hypothetical protein